jgi:hypothetical protein
MHEDFSMLHLHAQVVSKGMHGHKRLLSIFPSMSVTLLH